MIDRIKRVWRNNFLELNEFGRFWIVVGVACLLYALVHWIDPPTPLVTIKKIESTSDQSYRLLGLPGLVILWVCIGGAFIWVGLLFGKNKPK